MEEKLLITSRSMIQRYKLYDKYDTQQKYSNFSQAIGFHGNDRYNGNVSLPCSRKHRTEIPVPLKKDLVEKTLWLNCQNQ